MAHFVPELLDINGKNRILEGKSSQEGLTIYDIPAGKQQIHISVPFRDVAGFWHPLNVHPEMKLLWQIRYTAGAHRNFPYFTLFSDRHRNRVSLGLTELIAETGFFAKMSQMDGTYEITFTVDSPRPFQLFMDRRDIPWTECLASYRAKILPDGVPDYPAGAWDPVYCTWYAFHADLTQEAVEANARAAADLQFGTFILDDGWSYDNPQRVCASAKDWYKDIGNWTVSTKKFPDMANHVRRVQAMGLKYLFWVAPTMIGMNNPVFNETKCSTRCVYDPSFWHLDTADAASVSAVLKRMENVMKEYALDGLKVDFIDDEHPDPELGSAESTFRFIQELHRVVTSVRKDALIEFRQMYDTPQLLPYATQFRAGDVPFDYLDNFNRIAHIRAIVGDKVPVHADPVYWAKEETPENIARHLAASLAAVPMASMDLTELTEVEKKIFTHYIGFYRKHVEIYRKGHWNVEFSGTMASAISGSLDGETIAVIADPHKAQETAQNGTSGLHLLNLSPVSLDAPAAKAVYNGLGELLPVRVIPVGGRAEF